MFGSNWPVDVVYPSDVATTNPYRAPIAEADLTRDEQARVPAWNADAPTRNSVRKGVGRRREELDDGPKVDAGAARD